jgi:hypothetical protein
MEYNTFVSFNLSFSPSPRFGARVNKKKREEKHQAIIKTTRINEARRRKR